MSSCEDRVCRICIDTDPESDLIAPCKCAGSCKWVHRHCLDRWRTSESYVPFVRSNRFVQCEVCKFQYKYESSAVGITAIPKWKLNLLTARDICIMLALFQIPIILGMLIMSSSDDGQPMLKYYLPDSWPLGLIRYITSFFFVTVIVGIVTLTLICAYGCGRTGTTTSCPGDCNCNCGNCNGCDCKGSSDGLGAVLLVILVLLFLIGVAALISFLFFVTADFAEKRRRVVVNSSNVDAYRVQDLADSHVEADAANEDESERAPMIASMS